MPSAEHQLTHRHEGENLKPASQLCVCARPTDLRTGIRDKGQQHPPVPASPGGECCRPSSASRSWRAPASCQSCARSDRPGALCCAPNTCSIRARYGASHRAGAKLKLERFTSGRGRRAAQLQSWRPQSPGRTQYRQSGSRGGGPGSSARCHPRSSRRVDRDRAVIRALSSSESLGMTVSRSDNV